MGTLEELALQKLDLELLKKSSPFYGPTHPGLLTALLSHELQQRLWELRRNDSYYLYVTDIRPWFCGEVIVELSLCAVNDKVAREINAYHLPRLERLSIAHSQKLTDVGVRLGISTFNHLEQLSLTNCSGVSVAGLSSGPSVRSLSICESLRNGKPSSLLNTRLLSKCSAICLDGLNGGSDALLVALEHYLKNSPDQSRIEKLELRNNKKMTDAFTSCLSKTHTLKRLLIEFSNVTTRSLQTFACLPSLEHLDLSYCAIDFTLPGVHNFKEWFMFQNLKHLNLSGADFGSDHSSMFEDICSSPILEEFCANSCKLKIDASNNSGLHLLLSRVTRIDLSSNPGIGDGAFVNNRFLEFKVTDLNLNWTGVVNPNLLNAKSFPGLKTLHIKVPTLSPMFLFDLLGGGEQLALSNLYLTGGGGALHTLMMLMPPSSSHLRPSLQILELDGFSIPSQSRDAIVHAFPLCSISISSTDIHTGVEGGDNPDINRRNDAANSQSDTSSIPEDVLAAFARGVTHLNGALDEQDLEDHLLEDSRKYRNEPDDEEVMELDVVEDDFIHDCCHCADCVLNQRGRIMFPKVTYTPSNIRTLKSTIKLEARVYDEITPGMLKNASEIA